MPPSEVCVFTRRKATPYSASKTSRTPPFKGPFPPTHPRSVLCRDSLWEQAIGSRSFPQSERFRYRSNLDWRRVSRADSQCRFLLATVHLMRPCLQPCNPMGHGRPRRTSPWAQPLPSICSRLSEPNPNPTLGLIPAGISHQRPPRLRCTRPNPSTPFTHPPPRLSPTPPPVQP